MSKVADKVLLTTSHLRQWEAESVHLTREIEGLVAQRDKVHAKLAAARALLDGVDTEELPPVSKPRVVRKRGRSSTRIITVPTWPSEIMKALMGQKDGLTYAALKSVIKAGPLGARLSVSDKGFYGAVGKLRDAGKVVILPNNLVMLATEYGDYERRVAAGEVSADQAMSRERPSPMGDAILAFLVARTHGARSGDIVTEMLRYPAFHDTVLRNRTAVYNVVKRLVDRQKIKKVGDKYYAPKTNEPPKEQSMSGPYAGGVPADINPN